MAFDGANALQSVNMPKVTTIGQQAFGSASKLENVNMPNVRTIEDYAFSSTTSLTSVDMPNLTTIGKNAFSSLTSVNVPNVTTLGNYAFGYYLESITISDTASNMNGYSFSTTYSTLTDVNCIENPSNANTCEQVKALMKQNRARFSDDAFYIIT